MDDPQQDQLDDLQDRIDEVRADAEEHGTLPSTDPAPTLADPDGDGDVEPYEAPTGL